MIDAAGKDFADLAEGESAIFRPLGKTKFKAVGRVTAEKWTRAESERATFLAEACGGDEALRREVESLLAQPASAEGFLDGPAVALAAQMITDVGESALTGRRIGAYHVQGRLGAGGMGEVTGRSTPSLFGLLRSGQIKLRKIDGWHEMTQTNEAT